MKVLIVDDEAYAVNALTNRIDWNGFGFGTPLSARSMAQAQSVFLNEKIDLLLCDIEMPQGSGLDLFEWVKAYYPRTECIFVTCHDEYSYLRAAMQLGSCERRSGRLCSGSPGGSGLLPGSALIIHCLFAHLPHHPTTRISPALLRIFLHT